MCTENIYDKSANKKSCKTLSRKWSWRLARWDLAALIGVKIWWKNNFNPGNGLPDSGAEEKDIKTGGKELDTCDSYSWVPHPREKHQFLCLRILSHVVLLRLLFKSHFLCLQKFSQFSISLFPDIFSIINFYVCSYFLL